MRTRSIVIAVSIILAMVLFFTGIMVLVRVGSEAVAEGKRQEKMKVDLPESGIILRYCEGMYMTNYGLPEDFEPTSENNLQITVYADGRVVAAFFPYDKEYGTYGSPLTEEMKLSTEELDKLKDMIQKSGIRLVADLDHYYALDDEDAGVTVVHEQNGCSARRNVCADESLSYDDERAKTMELINYAGKIMGEDKTREFRNKIEIYKKEAFDAPWINN